MLDVCLLGSGGMMPLPYRWLTALMTRYNGSSLLIDCGEGTQIAIKEKGWSFKPIDVMCFTHYHADHIAGLPGILLTMGNAERTEPLTMIGPKGLERVVSALRMIAPELPFELRFIELTEPEQTIDIKGYRIHAFRVNHNVVCYWIYPGDLRAGVFQLRRQISISTAEILERSSEGKYRGDGWTSLYAGDGSRRAAQGDQSHLLYGYQTHQFHPGKCKSVGSVHL